MCFAPFFHLDVGPLGAFDVGVPGTFTPHAPPIRAVGTLDLCRNQTSRPRVIAVDYHTALHHGVAVSRQINKGPTFQTVDALSQNRAVVEVYELPIFLPPEHAPRMQIRYICGAAGVMHRTAKGKPVWKSNLGAPLSTRHIPMTSRRLRLLDGVELLRHRRHVAHVIASARWRRGSRSSPAITLRIS